MTLQPPISLRVLGKCEHCSCRVFSHAFVPLLLATAKLAVQRNLNIVASSNYPTQRTFSFSQAASNTTRADQSGAHARLDNLVASAVPLRRLHPCSLSRAFSLYGNHGTLIFKYVYHPEANHLPVPFTR